MPEKPRGLFINEIVMKNIDSNQTNFQCIKTIYSINIVNEDLIRNI